MEVVAKNYKSLHNALFHNAILRVAMSEIGVILPWFVLN